MAELRNVPDVHLLVPDQLNTYDVLVSDDVVFTTAALDRFLGGITLVPVEEPPEPIQPASTTRKTSTPARRAVARRQQQDEQ